MSTRKKTPNRVEQVENRLDRVERLLEQLAERQIHADNRLDRFEQALIASTVATQENIDRLTEQISQLSQKTEYMLGTIRGHISQPNPPAHSPQ